ncbi:hypothetical protein BDA99DRAFT_541494 [Phascolomyces articulosus]|uniref:Uncharacterized protein n=1 Tax=Phascolomyces articulosus TaxID=60185 RepID=A0AAD5JSC4_9FUNG|nr:hypothetical protein BDA99DRAFT_541494 [Phascolomyces articulosus]
MKSYIGFKRKQMVIRKRFSPWMEIMVVIVVEVAAVVVVVVVVAVVEWSDNDIASSYHPPRSSSSSSSASAIPNSKGIAYYYYLAVDKTNLTDKFLSYRKDVIESTRQLEELSVVDRLDDSSSGNRMMKSVWNKMITDCKKSFKVEPLEAEHFTWLYKINQSMRVDVEMANQLLRQWIKKVDQYPAIMNQDIYKDLIKSYSTTYNNDTLNEDTFIKDAIIPI